MLEPRDFVVDAAASNAYTTPKALVSTVVGAVLFTALGIFILRAYPYDIAARLAGIGAIVFFGGGALLVFVLISMRSFLGIVASLRVDLHGITWTNGFRRLALFGLGPKTRSIPWSNIAGLTITNTQDLPVIKAAEARRRSVLHGYAMNPRKNVQYVGVSVRDVDAVWSTAGVLTPARRALYDAAGGAFCAGPVVGLSADQLLQTLETYRAAAASTGAVDA